MDDSEACLHLGQKHSTTLIKIEIVCTREKYVDNDEQTPFVLLTIIDMALDADISRIRRNAGRQKTIYEYRIAMCIMSLSWSRG